MAILLKQSTASQEIPLGHFVDDTDGKTAETALTIANTDIKIWKNGATTLANKNSGGATHISGGIYYAVLDATDTDTLGGLIVFVLVSGALPVRVECRVLPANVYDSLVAASDKLQVDAVEVSGTTQTAGDVIAQIATRSSHSAADVWASGARTLTSFGTLAADVWASATRTLTAISDSAGVTTLLSRLTAGRATNLDNLDAAITTRSSHSAADVWSAGARTLTAFGFSVTVGTNNDKTGYSLAGGQLLVKRNTALNAFTFLMRDSADHVTPKTGLAVTAQRSIDGGAFAATANSVTELGSGVYKIDLAAADLNGTVITLKFTASGADQRTVTLITQA